MQKLKKCWMVAAVMLAGCGAHKGVTEVSGFEHGLAVLSSDYKASTALTLLDPNTHAVIDPCLNSGSVTPRLSLALSADVVLPSQAAASADLALIDRSNNAIVWVDAASCSVLSQLSVAGGNDKLDPQDIARISDTKAYVARYVANGDSSAGNDVLIVDPSKPAVGGTIALQSYATDPNVEAKPSRIVLVGELAFVTLNNINDDFSLYGPGRVVQIDTATDSVVGQIDLPDARSCAGMAVDGTWLAIGCDGAYGDPNQATQSAVYVYDVTDPRHPALNQTITAASLGQTNIASASLVLHGNVPWFVTNGDHDAVYSGATAALQGSGPFVLGGMAVTPQGALFVADATTADPAVIAQTPGDSAQRINTAPKSLLAPRGLLLY